MAVTEESILAGVVTLENQYTRLLANFMRHDPEFVRQALTLLFPGLSLSAESSFTIYTHKGLDGGKFGIPDLTLRTENVCLIVEVKIHTNLNLTPHERPGGEGYWKYRERESKRGVCEIAYLVPSGWHFDHAVPSETLQRWHQITDVLDGKKSDMHFWFHQLLMSRFGPVSFSTKEGRHMFNASFPLSTTIKLASVVDSLKKSAVKKFGAKNVKTYDGGSDDWGFNVYGKFYIGMWNSFWQAGHHYPICFGIQAPSADERRRFTLVMKQIYGQEPVEFEKEPWIMGYIPVDQLKSTEVGASKAAWKGLQTVLDAVFNV